ncbi:dihydrodipicolinate synthase family protein [Tardiphaga sp. vice352]|uniref:dihydrodipicolinate synthase family protein n=1 Tax=unclassified Tardiphaga TaxID=2631404 RepID=UPI00116508C1|nr:MULTISPECIES: dihydrodipicolinate synthase family protein [unclassified Tardiphaga]QDM18125.1 dihydrodipicolinate synthase family protein [Tardiphaga sp. vice278]QDM23161.1 dihydrodipicolinate synthase family protein [Tardiphaga sp. vice154]QDM28337.1 dihydrodipicolinate synthase family protein [Tardiphaga sp. vice304]QDM33471.1 dihydrodipicolinate synthase family protein [Tardiphaga sp. vice352]
MTSFLNGLSAFPITPADPIGKVDTAALRRLVTPLVTAKVDSIGLLGSTGIYPFLARAERRRAIDAALEETNGSVPVLVGIGALRTVEAIALAQDAKAAGASAGLLAPVSYTPLTEDEVFAHFSAVAAACDLPIVIYDNFGTTHFKFTPELIGRIARIPGVIAVKGASQAPELAADHHQQLRDAVPSGFSIGYSGDWNATEALLAGGDAWYCVAAGLFPKACLAIVHAVQTGDVAEARRLNAELQPLWALFQEFSSLRVMYAAAEILSVCNAEPPRPVLPLSDAAKQKVAQVLRELKLS